MKKHKVFISYYHKDDQEYKNELLWQNKLYDLFDDFSVHENEIDSTGMTTDRIRKTIRDFYIKDATVLILLCGKNTCRRKFIDWELHAAMYDTKKNPKMGILVINLPSIEKQWVRVSDEEEKALIAGNVNGEWVSLTARSEYEKEFPYMPSRIIDNFVKDIPISVVSWSRINHNPDVLKELIHNAYSRRKCINYCNGAKLKKYNTKSKYD